MTTAKMTNTEEENNSQDYADMGNIGDTANKEAAGTSDTSETKDTSASTSNQVEEDYKDCEKQPGVRQKLRTLTFGRRRKSLAKEASKSRKGPWGFKFGCKARRSSSSDIAEPSVGCSSCICTGYRRTDEHMLGPKVVFKATPPTRRRGSTSRIVQPNLPYGPVIDLTKFNPEDYPIDDWDERARQERAREIEEGVDPPPGFRSATAVATTAVAAATATAPAPAPVVPSIISTTCRPDTEIPSLALALQTRLSLANVASSAYLERFSEAAAGLPWDVLTRIWDMSTRDGNQQVHTQIDYMHCLVPDLLEITNCSFYWGKMDRYEAEKLLDNKPEGTFLLRDSAQEEYLFSVSFRRYGRSLHARIEQWNHKFSFDSHDPGVFSSKTVCGLIEHYKDPSCCMYFEPMLTIPLHRTFPFSLQHLCRSVVCSRVTYDGINKLQLPKSLKVYMKEYHYKQRVRVRQLDPEVEIFNPFIIRKP